jgi:hypothetical protein
VKWVKSFIQGKLDQIKDWEDPNREQNPMPSPEITVNGVDPVLYEKLLAELTAAGAVFDGSKVTFKGVEFQWAYDGISAVRYIILKKPFYFTEKLIQSQIEDSVEKAKVSV